MGIQFEWVNPETLKPNPKNPNVHSPDQIERLCELIKAYGWRHPIIVSKQTGLVVVGHGRLEAAIKMKEDKVPVHYQDFKDETEEYGFMVADNGIANWAELNLAAINAEIPNLGPDFDINLLGIKDFEIEPADKYADKDADAVPETKEAFVKSGELWLLGKHRLLCGDSTKREDVERVMNGEKADMLFTDPPYGVNYEGGHFHSGDVNVVRKREKLAADETPEIYSRIAPIIREFVDGPCYTWFASTKSRCVSEAIEAIEAIGELHSLIIWHKINATYAAMNAQYKQRHEPCFYWKPKGSTLRWCGPTDECTVWEIKRDGVNEFHPTQKPVALAERAIGNHEAKTVLDLFLGSGSTLIACEKTGRRCFGMEIDPHYCTVILERWAKFTGKDPIRESDSLTLSEIKKLQVN